MYYNAATPAMPIKLAQHDPWNSAVRLNGQVNGPQPASPGYAVYTNGMLPHHPPPHHHQHSLSIPSPYPPPPDPNAMVLRPEEPNGTPSSQAIGSPHWQQQLMKAETCRQSASPHHRARASAMATRNSSKAIIPITDPNRHSKHLIDGRTDHAETEDNQSHPSSTAAPVKTTVKQRATQDTESTPSWATLDIGGMRVKHVSLSLFKFTYLTTLFLNHNHLTVIPPQIERLRALILLDLSGNQLTTIPPELGLLTAMRELYLFDNHIASLPGELGTLHQLEMLGIDGNPISNDIRSILQKDGTSALIAYLRDTCPVPQPPPERLWTYLQSDAERKIQESDPSTETFTVLCYNILCEKAATSRLYGYTPSWALAWEYRKELILTEIMSYDADILCLQEVDIAQYEDYFMGHLANQGYEAVYYPRSRARTMSEPARRTVDGLATFYKSSKYQMVENHVIEFNQLALQRPDFKKTDDMFNRVLAKDHIGTVCSLESRATGSRLLVANLHIFWDPVYSDVKLVQTGLLMEEVQKIADQFAKLPPKPPAPIVEGSDPKDRPKPPPHYPDGLSIPTIVCGDFNSVPGSAVYNFLANGSIPGDHEDFMSHIYGSFTSEGMSHKLNLKSAYTGIGELPMTNFTPTFRGPLDYCWYSANTLNVIGLLGEIDQEYLNKAVGFPNAHFPSDHICILSEFRIKPPKDQPKTNR